jgi:hypothetical protein
MSGRQLGRPPSRLWAKTSLTQCSKRCQNPFSELPSRLAFLLSVRIEERIEDAVTGIGSRG